jgi:hypothetical protein
MIYSSVPAQTYKWADLVPLNFQFNPSLLHSPVAVDNAGNPVCARLVNYKEIYSSTIYGDIKLEKRNPSGSLLWESTIYGEADVSKITFDTDDNVICIGTYRDTITIETSRLIHSGSGAGNFILKLNNTGNLDWLKGGTEFPQYGVVTALGIKTSDNFLVGVTNYGTNSNIYEFNPDGNLVSTIEQPGVETINDLSVDNFGTIWATGFAFDGQVSFNGLDTIAPFIYNDYVVKYNSSGSAQWVNFIEDVSIGNFNIVTDNSGNAYLSGNLFTPMQFGNLHANGPQWVYDFFVTKIDPDGNYLWLNEIPPGNNLGDATIGNSNFLSCSEDGDIYITGFIREQVDFGNGVILSATEYDAALVLSYDSDGTVQWGKLAESDAFDVGCGIITDNNGSCYVTGVMNQNAVFDTITITGGEINLFLAKLNFDSPVNVEDGLRDNNNVAEDYILMQNYPNPFNPTTSLQYAVSSQQFVTLKLFDLLGREVATLVNEDKPPGTYEVEFNASGLVSGIYMYRLTAGSFTETKKMILLR